MQEEKEKSNNVSKTPQLRMHYGYVNKDRKAPTHAKNHFTKYLGRTLPGQANFVPVFNHFQSGKK